MHIYTCILDSLNGEPDLNDEVRRQSFVGLRLAIASTELVICIRIIYNSANKRLCKMNREV